MAATSSLREYQSNILQRLEEAKQEGAAIASGYLGVVIADQHVLVDMKEISETLPVMDIFPVPLVKSWFLGMTNVRGVLYAVNDLGQLISGQKTALSSHARILLVSNDVASHVAFLAERLIGIRKLEAMKQVDAGDIAQFCMLPIAYQDDDGKVWHVLDCKKLTEAKEFIQLY